MASDKELIVLCALRYALGRRTYVVSTVAEYIAKIKNPSDWLIDQVITEIDRQEKDKFGNLNPLGDDCDVVVWNSLRDKMKEKKEKV